jgi:hypothetical protein
MIGSNLCSCKNSFNLIEIVREVDKRVGLVKQEHGEDWGFEFFNNFDGNLPGGYRWDRDPAGVSSFKFDISGSKRVLTLGEFHRDVYIAMDKVGLCEENLLYVREKELDRHNVSDSGFFNMVLPVYIELRKMGHERSGLCS